MVGRRATFRRRRRYNPDPARFRIDIRLGQANPQGAHSAKGRGTVENRMRQGLLQVVAASARDPLDLVPEEVVIPRMEGIVPFGQCRVLEPDFHRDQQSLGCSDLEIMEADVDRHIERFEDDSRESGFSD